MTKPACKLVGTDGNVFSIIATVSRTLRKAGCPRLASEFADRAMSSDSYDDVLTLASEYVEIR